MTLAEWIATDGGIIIVILSLIQIAPIKVNPWSAMMKALGRSMNVELSDKLDKHEANEARYRIIRFDDEVRHSDTKHTEEHFDQIMDDIKLYELYCDKHPDYPNHKAKSAKENIKKLYQKCRDDNDFLI